MVDAVELAGNVLLFCLVFGMSATVDVTMLKKQLKNKKAILTGILLQFFLLPFLGFAVVSTLNMSHPMGITLLVLTSSPGGSYSNWWCSMFNGDLALSVTMTAVSTVLSIVMLPINLLIYANHSYGEDVIQSLDWVSLFVALVVVISAITLGLFVSAKVYSHKFNKLANQLGNVAGVALVVFSALMSNTGGGDSQIWARSWSFYVGVAAPCVLGLIISNFMTSFFWLKRPERVTVSIECCYQNVGIATSVALTMFEGEDLAEAMGVPLFYGLVEAVVIGIYCIVAWKVGWTKAPRDANFCTMISTSYEVVQAEMQELDSVEVSLGDVESNDTETTSPNQKTIFTYFQFDNLCGADVGMCAPEVVEGLGGDAVGAHKKEPSGYDISDLKEGIENESFCDENGVGTQPRLDFFRWRRRPETVGEDHKQDHVLT